MNTIVEEVQDGNSQADMDEPLQAQCSETYSEYAQLADEASWYPSKNNGKAQECAILATMEGQSCKIQKIGLSDIEKDDLKKELVMKHQKRIKGIQIMAKEARRDPRRQQSCIADY